MRNRSRKCRNKQVNRHVPFQTSLRELHGRGRIVDSIKFSDGSGTLVLDGEINGNLCETPTAGKFTLYSLAFALNLEQQTWIKGYIWRDTRIDRS
jgi:hypothetical protein